MKITIKIIKEKAVVEIEEGTTSSFITGDSGIVPGNLRELSPSGNRFGGGGNGMNKCNL